MADTLIPVKSYNPIFFEITPEGVLTLRAGLPLTLGGDVTGSSAANTVVKIQNRSVANIAPTDNQVLTWVAANTRWEPMTLVATGSVPETRTVQGTAPITIAGDNAAHDLTANRVWALAINSTLTVSGTQLAVVYGTGANTACQGNDARLSDSRTPTGSAGGDLASTYPNPTVAKIQGVTVDTAAPSNGHVLVYSSASTKWVPAFITTVGTTSGQTTYQGGTVVPSRNVSAGTDTPTSADARVVYSANCTITLDNALAVGTTLEIWGSVGTLSLILAPNGGGTINGSSTLTLDTSLGLCRVVYKQASLVWLAY